MDRVTGVALVFSALGCVAIDGGAVEASWVLSTNDGQRRISDCGCTCPPIAKIRFQLVPLSGGPDPCLGRASCQFSCDSWSGATRFDIPPDTYAISLVPAGADGKDIASSPSDPCRAGGGVDPLVREVKKGGLTQLNALMVHADCALECGGSDSTKVCGR